MAAMSSGGSNDNPIVVWLRSDLRLADNPAITHAVQSGRPLVVLYNLDDGSSGLRSLGSASRWWLENSLRGLDQDLKTIGGSLVLRRGPSARVLDEVVTATSAGAVCWNRRYDAAGIAIDAALKQSLRARGLSVSSFQANLLFEPWTVRSRAGEPFRVYSPFWRAAIATGAPRAPLAAPTRLTAPAVPVASDKLEDWSLSPTSPNWAAAFFQSWTPGEAGGRAKIETFLADGIGHYAEHRDRPGHQSTSRLSPHLAFGEISPFQIWHATRMVADQEPNHHRHAEKFLSEIGWREFSYHLLHHWPDLATNNFQSRFDSFPWSEDDAAVAAWRRGKTGIPLVDAGMRELWSTGWMHNRVRMIVGSFLVKHLLQDWRIGERWFWDTLLDADPANNAASWQWVAGSGADAAPYFRVFNPVLQGEKFDTDGGYVRRFVPELARLPAAYIHRPWEAPSNILVAAGVTLGQDYPYPIVDLAHGRDRALAAFESLKSPTNTANSA